MGSTPCTSNFQAISRSIAATIAGGAALSWKFPIAAMPVVFVLKPTECAPWTAAAMPPYRPSNTWPYLSTRKL